jgi:hypothetical protein
VQPKAICKVRGDGNCFYRALAASIIGADDDRTWRALKNLITEDAKLEQYRGEGVWADENVIAET